ncbi:hypothetical protein [Listeria immobilis]|uniref:hypothetical protein n=1 Tax=Listeria immobilis TaxID=2713502 RepID=UPI00164EC3BF|nr:hypothetical protein [Listeria immobilis]MBC6312009.1 hypothetical protein [Listeria immobilis]
MTREYIEQQASKEARELVAKLNHLAFCNEHITCTVVLGFKRDERLISETSAVGSREELLEMFHDIARALVYEFMHEHDCDCQIDAMVKSAIRGSVEGYNKFKTEAKEQADENN